MSAFFSLFWICCPENSLLLGWLSEKQIQVKLAEESRKKELAITVCVITNIFLVSHLVFLTWLCLPQYFQFIGGAVQTTMSSYIFIKNSGKRIIFGLSLQKGLLQGSQNLEMSGAKYKYMQSGNSLSSFT